MGAADVYYRECLASHTERLLVAEDRFALLAVTKLLLTLLNKHTLNQGFSHSSFTVWLILLTFYPLPPYHLHHQVRTTPFNK